MNTKISIIYKSFDAPEQENTKYDKKHTSQQNNVNVSSASARVEKSDEGARKLSQISSIRLPKTRTLFTVLRSPHIDKKSREQFEMRIDKKLIQFSSIANNLRAHLYRLKLHDISGVQVKIVVNYKTRLQYTTNFN